MAVLLHVQGAGRDPLRPFGGHAIRTVSWDRFDPGSVGPDVDTIIVSAPDPLTAVDAIAAIRESGDEHPVLLVPDDAPGWRQVAATRLPGADVVLGGLPALADYLPSADYPQDPGVRAEDDEGPHDARVIDLTRRVPRGSGRRLLRERMGESNDIATAVRDFTVDLARDRGPGEGRRVQSPGRERVEPGPSAPHGPDVRTAGTGTGARPRRGRETPDTVGDPPAARGPLPEGKEASSPFPPSTPSRRQLDMPSDPSVTTMDTPPTSADERPAARERVRTRTLVVPVAEAPAEDEPAGRRTARALGDPAVLVPALLSCVERLDGLHDTGIAVAEFVRASVPSDAVDVLVPDGRSWHTVCTVGTATGAGGAADAVDVHGLVAWLESFDSPVVLEGADLAAPGSWVLAALARATETTVGLVLCWRDPGRPVFEPASVTTVGELAADATAPLGLALQVRTLARSLSALAD